MKNGYHRGKLEHQIADPSSKQPQSDKTLSIVFVFSGKVLVFSNQYCQVFKDIKNYI